MATDERINHSLRRVVEAANAAIPDVPESHHQYGAMRRQKEILLVGIGWEIPAIRPSSVELSQVVGCSHQTARMHLERWHAMPWQDRYGWLRLVDGRLTSETHALDAALL